jgi:penicillin-binding protein 2
MERSAARLKILAALVALMFAALSSRLWFLQVLAHERYVEASIYTSVRIIETQAPRGRILDARGRPLVENRQSIEVHVNQQLLGEGAEDVLLRLAGVLDVPARRLAEALRDPRFYPYEPIPVAADVDLGAAAYLEEHAADFPGVTVVNAAVRSYPNGPLAAHVLGQVGRITREQVDDPRYEGYGPSDVVGQSGLESTYERWLRGDKGHVQYLVDASGDLLQRLGEQAPVPGNDVRLYLDLRAQRIAEQELREGIHRARGIADCTTCANPRLFRANAGAVVVLDPDTFGVVALASYPTFDPTWFVRGPTDEQWDYLNDDFLTPQFNRATQAALAPGSTFKPFIALSAVRSGLASLGGSFPCPPTFRYRLDPLNVFHNWSSRNYGYISLSTALTISCDTVFYAFGADFYDIYDRSTDDADDDVTEPLQRDLRLFGFGRPTGLDVAAESSGLVPDAGYVGSNPKLFPFGWLPGDSILMSIGQKDVQVTPLQLASAYAAIANGGRVCEPRLAERIQTEAGVVVRKIPLARDCRRLPFTGPQLDYVRSALYRVTTDPSGTAYYAFRGFPHEEVRVAGKTGTAERPGFDRGQDTSWFAAIVGPENDPEYVVVAMVEQGGHGSTTAAPIVRQVIERLYGVGPGDYVSGGTTD